MTSQDFPPGLDLNFSVALRSEPGNRAFFGRNVLQGLIDGIDDFVNQRENRWERDGYRIGAPVMLGCTPWVSDDKLLAAIESLPGACVLVSKHRRTPGGEAGAERLREINERTNGIEFRALSGLSDMAPKVSGQPRVIGPYDRMHEEGAALETFRTIGFRKVGRERPPIAHAKLALLGNMCWTDEHPAGGVDEYLWFSPRRLWVSSANFTYGSRRLMELGYWTEDRDLLDGVHRFLIGLIGVSEDIDSAADNVDPELALVEYDDVAMAEALGEHMLAEEEWEALVDEDREEG